MTPSNISSPTSHHWIRWILWAVLSVLVAGTAWAAWTWWSARDALDQVSLDRITQRQSPVPGEPEARGVLNFLLVGSDDREGLSEEERQRLHTGDFAGQQTDTILLVQVRQDDVSVLSFPRDLRVDLPGGETGKINAVRALGGPNALVGTVEDILGIDVDHYVEVSILSFLRIVDAAGGVRICLDEPLRDRKSGADFPAGCHRMDGAEALSYVRSRTGVRADFTRMERQQRFVSALADRTTSLGVLANPVRVRDLATRVAEGLTVDDDLDVSRMVQLATRFDDALEQGLDTATLPTYAEEIDGVDYVVAYEPGVAEVSRRLADGGPLPGEGLDVDRGEVTVLLWSGNAPGEAGRVEGVLHLAGWDLSVGGAGPDGIDEDATTVYTVDDRDLAQAVAGMLGADLEDLPSDVSVPEGSDVVVRAADA